LPPTRHLTLLLALSTLAPIAWARDNKAPAPGSPCADIPHADHPKAFITNGTVDAMIFLPDAVNGYNRASRFDWAGVVPCLAFKGHTYFGEWFTRYDPEIHDAITGPVEDFRTGENETAIGYDAAKPGEPFVKIGVGGLRKLTDKPYSFAVHYPIVDGGQRTTKISKRSIVFTQRLKGPNGVAYLYTKTLTLDPHGAILNLEHTIKNIGTATIDTEVFDHNFFVIDKHATDPDMVVHFKFPPVPIPPFSPKAAIQGNDLVYLSGLETKPREAVVGYMTGYSDKVSDFDITVENQKTKVGVELTSDQPMSKFHFWSPSTTICPEAYVHLVIPPGKSGHYTLHYRFFANGV
jgi:hypothetical protein